ncbi:MAG TPA: ParB N-terminal domain-containing protein [Actinomycetota bacterium]|nr:ParB N-terminal domain-containing protein [Actinomycetota bacterium]
MTGARDRSTFDRARRQKAGRRLIGRLRDEDTQELLPLSEVTRRLRMFEQSHVGVHPIRIDRIVGTVDRTGDFDREFLPRRPQIGPRWKQVEEAFPDSDFPPIVVYEVDGRYFLVDGHHRVAIAKRRGVQTIDADITRLRTRSPLPPDADIGRIIYVERQRHFMEESGLGRARPDAVIELTRPQGFLELLEQVRVHGYNLMRERGQVISDEEVAADWYDRVFIPAVEAFRTEGLPELYPAATDGDLVLWLHERQRALLPERGPLSYAETAHIAAEDARRHRTPPRQIVRGLKRRAAPSKRGRPST